MTRAERRAARAALRATLSRLDVEIDATHGDPLRGVPPTTLPAWLPGPAPLVIPVPVARDAWSDDPDRTTRRGAH